MSLKTGDGKMGFFLKMINEEKKGKQNEQWTTTETVGNIVC